MASAGSGGPGSAAASRRAGSKGTQNGGKKGGIGPSKQEQQEARRRRKRKERADASKRRLLLTARNTPEYDPYLTPRPGVFEDLGAGTRPGMPDADMVRWDDRTRIFDVTLGMLDKKSRRQFAAVAKVVMAAYRRRKTIGLTINGGITAETARRLTVRRYQHLEELSGRLLCRWGAKHVSDALILSLHERVQRLHLRNNGLGAGGAQALAAGLAKCTVLEHLDLSANEIADEGATAIAAILPSCINLKTLNIALNAIMGDGGAAVAGKVTMCPALQDLDMSNNPLGGEVAWTFARRVTKYQNLSRLNLSTCEFRQRGGQGLVRFVKGYHNLEYLDVSWNAITVDRAAMLADLATMQKDPPLHLEASPELPLRGPKGWKAFDVEDTTETAAASICSTDAETAT